MNCLGSGSGARAICLSLYLLIMTGQERYKKLLYFAHHNCIWAQLSSQVSNPLCHILSPARCLNPQCHISSVYLSRCLNPLCQISSVYLSRCLNPLCHISSVYLSLSNQSSYCSFKSTPPSPHKELDNYMAQFQDTHTHTHTHAHTLSQLAKCTSQFTACVDLGQPFLTSLLFLDRVPQTLQKFNTRSTLNQKGLRVHPQCMGRHQHSSLYQAVPIIGIK